MLACDTVLLSGFVCFRPAWCCWAVFVLSLYHVPGEFHSSASKHPFVWEEGKKRDLHGGFLILQLSVAAHSCVAQSCSLTHAVFARCGIDGDECALPV